MASNGIRDLIQQNLLESFATGKNQAYITPQARLQAQQKAQQQVAQQIPIGTKHSVRDLYEQNLREQLATGQSLQQASLQAHRLTHEQATDQLNQQAQAQQQAKEQQRAQQRTQQQTQPQTQKQPQAQAQPQAQPQAQAQPQVQAQPQAQAAATPAPQRVFVEPTLLTTAQDAYANRGTPYADLAKAYEERTRANLTAQEEAMAKQLAASKEATAANYDSAAAGNYLNYVKQQNAIGEQLARQGIRGGASESALARIGNNYAMNQGNTTAQRYAAYGQLQNAYDTNVANMRQTAEENIMNNNLALQQSQIQYDDTLAQRAAEESRYNQELVRAARERFEDMERDDKIRSDTWAREDKLLADANAREDALRELTWGREDALTAAANEREDARYQEEVERAIREREEDIAREDKRYKQEQKTAAQQYKDEQEWKDKEWDRYQYEKKLEEYSAGLLKYVKVETLEKMLKKLKKDKNWAKDPFTYGKVQAINNRIGVIRAEKKK